MESTLRLESPIGPLFLHAEDNDLTRVSFSPLVKHYPKQTQHPILRQASEQLVNYFDHGTHSFDVPLKLTGTDFQNQVWRALTTIPFGQTQSYGQIAKQIKHPKAARAVGMANNKNPIVIIVPCHRVIGASGQLVGYGGGLGVKEWLLKHEQAPNT